MSNHQGSIIWHTSSNMTLIVSTVEYWAAIWLSMCSDLSRISPILSVLMMEWCLVRSRCSSWTWSFRFWISVWKDYKHTHTHAYTAHQIQHEELLDVFKTAAIWRVCRCQVKRIWAWKPCCLPDRSRRNSQRKSRSWAVFTLFEDQRWCQLHGVRHELRVKSKLSASLSHILKLLLCVLVWHHSNVK